MIVGTIVYRLRSGWYRIESIEVSGYPNHFNMRPSVMFHSGYDLLARKDKVAEAVRRIDTSVLEGHENHH